jgi:uncharacterized protein with FMN-binding domain
VSVKDGKITNVRLVKRFASWIGARADTIPAEIVKAQSLDVDAVSGATSSSKTILMAAEAALNSEPQPLAQ